MIFYNSKKQPIHYYGRLVSGEICPCDPCRKNECEFIPEYSSVFHMAGAGGFLPWLNVNCVKIIEEDGTVTLPMTLTSYNNISDGKQFAPWYDLFTGERYSVQDIIDGKAEIKNLYSTGDWEATSEFRQVRGGDVYCVRIAAAYASKPTQWSLTMEDGGSYIDLFKNRFNLYYYHWQDGDLIRAAPDASYTARLYSLNLTQSQIFIDPTIIAGTRTFNYTQTGASYRGKYDLDLNFEDIIQQITEPDFCDFRWVMPGVVSGASIYYADASDSVSPVTFEFMADSSLSVGWYKPSITGCPCPAGTLSYLPNPVPPDDIPDDYIPATPQSSSTSSTSRSSTSRSSTSRSSTSRSSTSRSSTSRSSTSSLPLYSSSIAISSHASSTTPEPSTDSSGTPALYYLLYSAVYACYYSEEKQGFFLSFAGSVDYMGAYLDPADLPHQDGERETLADGSVILYIVDGPVDPATAVAPTPEQYLEACSPEGCIEGNYSNSESGYMSCFIYDMYPSNIDRVIILEGVTVSDGAYFMVFDGTSGNFKTFTADGSFYASAGAYIVISLEIPGEGGSGSCTYKICDAQ